MQNELQKDFLSSLLDVNHDGGHYSSDPAAVYTHQQHPHPHPGQQPSAGIHQAASLDNLLHIDFMNPALSAMSLQVDPSTMSPSSPTSPGLSPGQGQSPFGPNSNNPHAQQLMLEQQFKVQQLQQLQQLQNQIFQQQVQSLSHCQKLFSLNSHFHIHR
jgi:hypothetical protein